MTVVPIDSTSEVRRFTPSATPAHLHTPPSLALDQRILDRFVRTLRLCGVVGEERNARLIYLALTSRLLDRPVSLAIKGVSSSGKSFTVERTTRFFPADAFLPMTGMSERALVYSKEQYKHRTIVLYEATALREQREKTESNLTAYFVRSLLSEGRLDYEVTVRDKNEGFVTRRIVKEGPTNLIVTTTATSLHGENETRLLSLPTDDSPEQTAAILLKLASRNSHLPDLTEWHALQAWLESSAAKRQVDIPFAKDLAKSVRPVAPRLRRDFEAVLCLIETHALLHQLTREEDEQGRIVATEADYQAIRALVGDLVSEGVGATVSETIRETVAAVAALAPPGSEEEGFLGGSWASGAKIQAVADKLGVDRTVASRRLSAARERGFVKNLETKRGSPARYVIDEPLPDETPLLPHTCTPSVSECAGQE